MATPLPLLLLLLLLLLASAVKRDNFATELRLVCVGRAHSEATVQAAQCPEPPCNTSTDEVTLTLPVLLSLLSNVSSMGAMLQLRGAASSERGLVAVWRNEHSRLVKGAACDGSERVAKLPPQDLVGVWVHMYFVAEEQHLHVKQVMNDTLKTLLSLWYTQHLPTALTVLPHARFGYSALALAPTTTTTTTLLHAGVGVATTALVVLLVVLLRHIATTHRPPATTTVAPKGVPQGVAPRPPEDPCARLAMEDILYMRVL